MKIYISGKITGDRNYKDKFKKAEEEIRFKGATPISPAILPDGLTQADYMRISLTMLDCADGVLLLSDWEDSWGARIEKEYAEKVGKMIVGVLKVAG